MQIAFSVIMPSYLGDYKNAAKDRDVKIIRAVNSVLGQTYPDFELIVIADGCEKTVDILSRNFADKEKLRIFMIEKQPMWSGNVRNAGIKVSKNDWIVYLDIDDMFGERHLEKIANGIKEHPGYQWYWFNDLSYNSRAKRFDEHGINIDKRGQNGTSNICHRGDIGVYWPAKGTYLHDWIFVNKLKAISKQYTKIQTPEYQICHVPKLLDV